VKFFCGVVLTSAELFFLLFVYSYFFWNRPNISWDPWNIFRFVLTYGFVEPSLSGFLENLKPLSGIFLRYIYTSRNLLLAVASSLPLHFPNDMSSWAHFLAEYRAVECASGAQPCFHPFSEDSEKHPTHSPVILRALSSSPLQSMTRDTPDASSVRQDIATCRSSEASIPCRDLSTAFEELYIEPNGAADTPIVKQSSKNDPTSDVISPVGVAELHSMALASPSSDAMLPSKIHVDTPKQESLEPRTGLPHFELHKDLKRDLSDALVDRVLFYSIIHDINKEASTMAGHDDSGYNRSPEDPQEAYDPLIVAINGQPQEPFPSSTSIIQAAVIDEERWLLETIDARGTDESRAVKACPPTFLQAMGERDYENPMTSLSNGSRTQLWKPSRSWWEAKSGKNPWIEPTSHNKRWR
jgi:hypothetical protein